MAVTGMGAVSPLGPSLRAYIAGLRAGRSGTAALPPDMPGLERIASSVAAPCAEFQPTSVMSEADVRRLPRLVPMALDACRQALRQAGLWPVPAEDSRRIGLILGTGAGGIDFTLDQAQVGYIPGAKKQPSLWTITNATHGNLAGELSIRLGLRAQSWCVSTGCASSSDSMGIALDTLRSDRPGTPDAIVVVGADAHIRWETLLGMELLRVISTRDHRGPAGAPHTASRPFDRDRDGFVLAEGAWALVLERPSSARERGATPLAHLLGYGVTCDAYHRVRPDPDMHESARAMQLATQDAHLSPSDVDVLHYHGTATPVNDGAESHAVRLAFGDHAARLIGHSVKGAIGHPQGACGAAAAVATIGAMIGADGGPAFLPPTINLDAPDLAGGCDLDYTPNKPRPRGESRVAMINCLAFGAKNSALLFDVEPGA